MRFARTWRVLTIYRIGIWLPLLVPIVLGGIGRIAGPLLAESLGRLAQLLLMSLVYGGVPYAAFAVWATWWTGRHSEPEIRTLMFRAPLIMGAFFFVVTVIAGRATGQVGQFMAVGVPGLVLTIAIGYVYVFIVVLLRQELGPKDAP